MTAAATQLELVSTRMDVEAGGGPFLLRDLTIGVFANDQPAHRVAIGSDRRATTPLMADEGWIMPGGAEGVCEFDLPLQFATVALGRGLLEEVGLSTGGDIAPQVGTHDPLVLQMVRTLDGLDEQTPSLYRQTLARALAAHLVQTLPVTGGSVPSWRSELAPLDDKRLMRALDHIHDRLGDDLSLDALAAEATMSPFHFSRRFKSATGRSPLQYVIRERMRVAQVMLDTDTLPVVEIALRVGYTDVSRFRQHFKRHVGLTPNAWRKR